MPDTRRHVDGRWWQDSTRDTLTSLEERGIVVKCGCCETRRFSGCQPARQALVDKGWSLSPADSLPESRKTGPELRTRSIAVLHYFYVENLDILLRFLLINSRVFDLVNHIQTLNGSAEDCMLVIKPWLETISMIHNLINSKTYSLLGSYEKLASICIRSRICHTESVWFIMLQSAKLVLKFPPPDTLPTSSIS